MTGPSAAWDDVPHEDWCPAKHREHECECLRSDVLEARMWARHGFEIGQRSCTWSDQGVAPEWLHSGHDYASFVTVANRGSVASP